MLGGGSGLGRMRRALVCSRGAGWVVRIRAKMRMKVKMKVV